MMKLLHLKVVLAAIDTDESSLHTLQAARELATAAGARLHVVHATPTVHRNEHIVQATAADGANALHALFEQAGLQGSNVRLQVVTGEPTHVIRSVGDKIRADVIVLGEHRRSRPNRQGMGSTALGVVTNSWAPCLLLSRPMRLPLEHVLAPVDLSTTARGALVVALSWASALRGTHKIAEAGSSEKVVLTALRVEGGEGEASRQALNEELDQLRGDAGTWAGVGVSGVVVVNRDVPRAIADYAREHQSDLVVLGTRGLGSDALGRLGSVALGVACQLDLPILLVPPAVWESYAVKS
jgi:nucleotide-binding universal stress UspA family protein